MKAHAPMIRRDVERVEEPSIRFISFFIIVATVGVELGMLEAVGDNVGDWMRKRKTTF